MVFHRGAFSGSGNTFPEVGTGGHKLSRGTALVSRAALPPLPDPGDVITDDLPRTEETCYDQEGGSR